MSHEVETMAWAHEVPWHGLGTEIRPDATPEEMLDASGLNWTIDKATLYTKFEGREHRVPGRKALIRSKDGKVMGVASDNWTPLQNRDLLGFFRDYSEAGGASLETAGSLRGGSVVWALANLHDGFRAGGNDAVKGYLLFTSPHKVGSAITIRTTTVRVVCANTMAMAESEGGVEYKQNHLSVFDFSAARAAVEQAHEGLKHAAARAETLKTLKLSLADRTRVLAPFFEADALTDAELADPQNWPKSLTEVQMAVESGPGAEPETAWGTLQGVLYYADHLAGRNAGTRMFRSWVGDLGKLKLDVERELVQMAT